MTFWECFQEKEFEKKLWKLCLTSNFYAGKDYMKNLMFGMLNLPSLMTPRCSKREFQKEI